MGGYGMPELSGYGCTTMIIDTRANANLTEQRLNVDGEFGGGMTSPV
jgi:hypothetical protein